MPFAMRCAATIILAQAATAQPPASARHVISASAVAAALGRAGLPVASQRVHMPGVVSARTDVPELEVTGARQRANGDLTARISCRNAPDCMPFFVTVDGPLERDAVAAVAARSSAKTAGEPARANTDGIAVGARVTLELADAQMRIVLPAIAIDTGAPGTEVRVSSPDRKHTWRAVVIDGTTVHGSLQ